MSSDVPVLLIVWRRPETTKQVIDALRLIAPSKVFVACDGPRDLESEESSKVLLTRELIDRELDWPCQIEKRYSEVNQGCKAGVSDAITWFFERVEFGIILEDDCVPHVDFFRFCDDMLRLYAADERISMVTGNNWQRGRRRGDASYYFSKYTHIWGWATWRRAWNLYDGEIAFWPEWKLTRSWKKVLPDPLERQFWTSIFDKTYLGKWSTSWDYPWICCVWYNGGLTVTPNVNLVTNIGFGSDATHTFKDEHSFRISSDELGVVTNPRSVSCDHTADRYVFDHNFGGLKLRANRPSLARRVIGVAQGSIGRLVHALRS